MSNLSLFYLNGVDVVEETNAASESYNKILKGDELHHEPQKVGRFVEKAKTILDGRLTQFHLALLRLRKRGNQSTSASQRNEESTDFPEAFSEVWHRSTPHSSQSQGKSSQSLSHQIAIITAGFHFNDARVNLDISQFVNYDCILQILFTLFKSNSYITTYFKTLRDSELNLANNLVETFRLIDARKFHETKTYVLKNILLYEIGDVDESTMAESELLYVAALSPLVRIRTTQSCKKSCIKSTPIIKLISNDKNLSSAELMRNFNSSTINPTCNICKLSNVKVTNEFIEKTHLPFVIFSYDLSKESPISETNIPTSIKIVNRNYDLFAYTFLLENLELCLSRETRRNPNIMKMILETLFEPQLVIK